MTNYKLEAKREELIHKRERLIKGINVREIEIKVNEDELEFTELLLKAVEKEMKDRNMNLDQIDEANK